MNVTNLGSVEEFANSDAWLSEQLFAQLKDFNSDFKDKDNVVDSILPSIDLNDDLKDVELSEKPQDLTKKRLESFESVFRQNVPPSFETSPEILELSMMPEKELKGDEASLLDIAASVMPIVDSGVNNEILDTPPPVNTVTAFDGTEEEMKLLKYLESQSKHGYLDPKVTLPAELPSTAYRIVKCSNCNCLFDILSFQAHVCDYDEQHNLIMPQLPTTPIVNKQSKEEPLLPPEPACIRLLRENQIRIRRFLKDELKYDVHAASTNNNSSNSGLNSSMLSTNSSTSSTTKKPDGPHECTLCERKFVHASGLLRHMEKHAMDLIPTPGAGPVGGKSSAAAGSSFQSVNGLRVVIKCSLCGRIFFEPKASFKHLCSHFPGSLNEEKELDNSAEIPYESYVDDALNFLKIEVKSFSSVTAPFHEDKPPAYLKMVILSCILQCEFCDFVFSEVSYLFVHSACHLPERRFECFSCDIHMRTSKEISTHWQAECVFMRENLKVHQATTQRYFVCNVCENKFQSLDQLHEHRYTAYHFFPRLHKTLGVLQLPCEYCDVVFEYAQECVAHYEEKHYKKYKRDKDGTGSSGKTRQYLCDICGKSYTQSSHLWQHLRFHQGVKPFACKEPGCSRKFTIRPDLNDHIRKCHTGERPYHCLVCGKRFLTGSVFYQHRLIHRGERRYECEECGKRFYRADALKNHQRIHTGEKPYGCLFCTKNFRQRGDRDKHIRARHSHLDANARLMMQMQKLQLEAAAAAAAAQVQAQQQQTVASGGLTQNGTVAVSDQQIDSNDVVMIGNVAFPKSMFDSIMPDLDPEVALKGIQMP